LNKKIKIYTILVSIAVHILLFVITDSALKYKLFGLDINKPEIKEPPPIIFDLTDKEKPKEIIESPDIKQKTEKNKTAKYLSDKNLDASNVVSDKKLPKKNPFSKGEIDAPLISGKISIKNKRDEQPEQNGQTELKKKLNRTTENFEKNKNKIKGLYDFHANEELLAKNLESQVEKQGGFSFSTYNWNFAPYMLEMKRKIQSNIFPPLAFKSLGLINGETILKFTINRNGTLSDLKLIDYKGHKSLMETSLQAIKISAPFKKLPEDFPDKVLIVTGKFIYFVRR